jgi:molybdopterin adenylyltransferase
MARTKTDELVNRRCNKVQIQVGIITISDRASAGEYEDLGGPALKEVAQKTGWQVISEAIVPDDAERVQDTTRSFSERGCGLILTTGGTGIGPRDVTPEAIRAIMRVESPGFGEVMRAESMKISPNAILSRSLAALVDLSLVIALPGKPSGAVECLGFVAGAIPHAVALAQRKPTTC